MTIQLTRVCMILSLLLLTSCAGIKMVDQWTDPGFDAKLNNIMVLSLSQSVNSRRWFEDGFLKVLQQRGFQSEISYKLLPENDDLNKDRVKAAIVDSEIDAVLVLREVKITSNTTYRQVEASGARDNFYNYVGSYGAPSAVETVEDKVVHLESSLYAVVGAQLIWSGKVELEKPKDRNTVLSEMAERIVDEIAATGFLQKSKDSP